MISKDAGQFQPKKKKQFRMCTHCYSSTHQLFYRWNQIQMIACRLQSVDRDRFSLTNVPPRYPI